MSDAFDRAVRFVLGQEGGLVDDPHGGLTNMGISQRAYPEEDIANLTRDRAIFLYRRDYWTAAHCDALPWPLGLVLFDGVVQHGAGKATRFLQEALHVAADGDLGPATRAAAATAPAHDVVADYLARRALLYVQERDPGDLHGWFRRLFDLALEALTPAPPPPSLLREELLP